MNIAFDNVCFKGSIVSPSARFVYMCLCKHADSTLQTCFPSITRIAEIVGKSISTVKRAVRELCKYGAIERNPRFRKDGGQTSNLYKVAQVDLDSLTKVPVNSKNEEAEEQMGKQNPAINNICISESITDNEPACACMTTYSVIEQETNYEKSINALLENDIHNLENNSENNSETEFAELHKCASQEEEHNIEIDAKIHRCFMSKINKDENISTEPRSANGFNALNILKKLVFNLAKTITTMIRPNKIHSFRHNELGGGHRWPPKN